MRSGRVFEREARLNAQLIDAAIRNNVASLLIPFFARPVFHCLDVGNLAVAIVAPAFLIVAFEPSPVILAYGASESILTIQSKFLQTTAILCNNQFLKM